MNLMQKTRRYGRVILHAFEMTMRNNFSDAFILFGVLVQPVIIALVAFWMLQERGGDYVIFVVVGSGMTGLWTAVLFISGNSITQERWTGTLEMLVATPTPVQVIVFGKNLAVVTQSLLSMVVSFSLAIVIFQAVPTINYPPLFVLVLLFALGSYVSFGLLLSPTFVLNPDVQRWQNGLEFPVYILCGFLFPIALLPNWTTPLSYVLAPYWAATALHEASSGGGDLRIIGLSLLMMVLLSGVYLLISRKLFRDLLYRARVDATLGIQ